MAQRYTRQDILAAIRRLADQTGGGAPPGKNRFEAATGISESAWLGIFWRSWSDAVIEAGYTPNTMQVKLDDDVILDHLARLTLRLGRLPTKADLQLERRRNREIPSHNTIARLGSQADRLKLLREHSATRPELSAVLDILPLPSKDEKAESRAASLMEPTTGYVYLIRMGKFYKIGRTNDLGRRAYELRTQLPERVELVHSLETDDPEGIERYWHIRFADKRANGEWFQLLRADVAAFKRRGQFM